MSVPWRACPNWNWCEIHCSFVTACTYYTMIWWCVLVQIATARPCLVIIFIQRLHWLCTFLVVEWYSINTTFFTLHWDQNDIMSLLAMSSIIDFCFLLCSCSYSRGWSQCVCRKMVHAAPHMHSIWCIVDYSWFWWRLAWPNSCPSSCFGQQQFPSHHIWLAYMDQSFNHHIVQL